MFRLGHRTNTAGKLRNAQDMNDLAICSKATPYAGAEAQGQFIPFGVGYIKLPNLSMSWSWLGFSE